MKKYWIEKIEYPDVNCIPYGENSYDDKNFALQEFTDCINSLKDETTCVALYEYDTEYDCDTRIRIYDNGIITNEE